MEGPVAPVVAWMENVSQRKAPGAMSAMAFIVRPVRPRVFCISTVPTLVSSAMRNLLVVLIGLWAGMSGDRGACPTIYRTCNYGTCNGGYKAAAQSSPPILDVLVWSKCIKPVQVIQQDST